MIQREGTILNRLNFMVLLKRGHCDVMKAKPGKEQEALPEFMTAKRRSKLKLEGVSEEDSMVLCKVSPGHVRPTA